MDRKLGLRLARKFKLSKTKEVIESGRCYPDIFRMAIEELGSVDKLVEILKKSKSAEFAYSALCHVSLLTKTQKNSLIQMIIDFKSVYRASSALCYVSGLTKTQKNSLIQSIVDSKSAHYAYFVLCYSGPTKTQKKLLKSVS